VALPTGPSTVQQAVAHGIHLFRYEGVPVAALQTGGQPEYGRGDAALEIVAPAGIAERIITDVRRLVVERSVFHGQVLTLGSGEDAYKRKPMPAPASARARSRPGQGAGPGKEPEYL
jgi:hypothetical protein